ncbi:MAG: hypothetical protein J7M12_04320, partial [Candidatus Hydrogenedentes bacterium]|nr:hypothetical protein [Candidatus Hydrogenedentota bacterium]
DVVCAPFSFDSAAGTPVTLADDNSVFVPFTGGFQFSFYGILRDGVNICSNGSVTFAPEDDVTFSGSAAEFLFEEPRIGVFYDDIDPTRRGSVFFRQEPNAFIVTWENVSEYRDGSAPLNSNTFQIRLDADGSITFSYNGIALDATDAIVGLSPGGATDVSTLDFNADCPASPSGPAVIERFETPDGVDPQIDIIQLSRLFFETHPDDFDFLMAFSDFDISLGGAFAFEVSVQNQIQGISAPGTKRFDNTAAFGSAGRLQGFLNLGEIRRYPNDPTDLVLRTNSSLALLAHEVGHRWLAFVNFSDGGTPSAAILGRQQAHWSFFFDSRGSFMEGNGWTDNGDGTFTSTEVTDRYSPLDLYLMGMIPPEDVPPMFLITDHDSSISPAQAPTLGVTVTGTRKPVTVDDIISASGPRVPSWQNAQHAFRQAFVLFVKNGETPKPESIQRINILRAAWEPFFANVTLGRGQVSTDLEPEPEPIVEGTSSGTPALWTVLIAAVSALGLYIVSRRRYGS